MGHRYTSLRSVRSIPDYPGFPAMVDCEELEGLVMMGDGRADIHFFIQTVKDGTYGLYPYRNKGVILYSG